MVNPNILHVKNGEAPTYNVLRFNRKQEKLNGKNMVNHSILSNGNIVIKKEKIRKFMKDKQRQFNEQRENKKQEEI